MTCQNTAAEICIYKLKCICLLGWQHIRLSCCQDERSTFNLSYFPAAVYNIILSLYIANTLQTSRSWKSNVITYSKMINICKHIVDFLIHTIHNIRKTLEGWGYLSHIWVQSLIQIMLTFKWRIFKMGICITSLFNSKVSGANNTFTFERKAPQKRCKESLH